MDPAKMAEAKVKGAPGENHKILESLAGDWDATSQWWMTKDAQPMESKATASSKMVLGGRFLHQEYKGEAMGEPFEGMGVTGYDNVKQEFTSVWMDNMATGIMTSSGQYDPATKSIGEQGTFSCPMTGKKDMKFRSVLKIVDNDHFTYEMYGNGMDDKGPEFKTMEINYTRK